MTRNVAENYLSSNEIQGLLDKFYKANGQAYLKEVRKKNTIQNGKYFNKATIHLKFKTRLFQKNVSLLTRIEYYFTESIGKKMWKAIGNWFRTLF